jgi:hypothetical protein
MGFLVFLNVVLALLNALMCARVSKRLEYAETRLAHLEVKHLLRGGY